MTIPVLVIVATAGLAEIHAFVVAGVADPVSVVVDPIQTFNVPLIVGSALTVTVAVISQPFELVYVITEVPAETPLTTPRLSIVATAVFEDTQAFVVAGVADPVSVVVKPSQTVKVPVIVGSAFTVTLAVISQPFELV